VTSENRCSGFIVNRVSAHWERFAGSSGSVIGAAMTLQLVQLLSSAGRVGICSTEYFAKLAAVAGRWLLQGDVAASGLAGWLAGGLSCFFCLVARSRAMERSYLNNETHNQSKSMVQTFDIQIAKERKGNYKWWRR